MRHKYLLIILFLFISLNDYSQNISTQKGLTTAVFNLQPGVIKIFLPEDIRPGETISGTIQVLPNGKNEKQMMKNLEALKKYSVDIDGQRSPVSGANSHVQYKLDPGKTLHRPLSIINSSGISVAQTIIQIHGTPVSQSSPAGCSIPTHALTASPLTITGPFDGSSDNTKCSVGGQPAEVLAESATQCIIRFPSNVNGMRSLQVKENDREKCNRDISAVNLDVSTGKLNLLKDERTFIKVLVTGLKGLPDTAVLTITNTTTDIVQMQPTNQYRVMLPPDSAAGDTYERSFTIQSIKTGDFNVNVDLDLPQPPVYTSVRKEGEPPVVFADNKGGIELHPLKVDGLKNGMSDAFKKAVIEITGNRGNKYPELDGCGSCLTCIQSMLDEVKVALVGEIGKILMEHYLDILVGKAGGALAWIKDKYDKLEKAGDIAEAIADAVTKGEMQVVQFEERLCGYCLVSAIGFYDTKTQCMDAFFYCKGSRMCCSHALTIIHLKYCVGDDGFKKPNTGLDIDVISK
jgi:hypothetical protein